MFFFLKKYIYCTLLPENYVIGLGLKVLKSIGNSTLTLHYNDADFIDILSLGKEVDLNNLKDVDDDLTDVILCIGFTITSAFLNSKILFN